MTKTSIRSDRLHRIRRRVYAPLVVAVAAATVCSGASIATAEPASSSNADSATTYAWHVANRTGHSLSYGRFTKGKYILGETDGRESSLEFGGTTPWAALKPGERTADAFLTPNAMAQNFTRGLLCLDGTQLWELPSQATATSDWHEVNIFAGPNGADGIQLIATPSGGHDDRGLVYRGSCHA